MFLITQSERSFNNMKNRLAALIKSMRKLTGSYMLRSLINAEARHKIAKQQ